MTEVGTLSAEEEHLLHIIKSITIVDILHEPGTVEIMMFNRPIYAIIRLSIAHPYGVSVHGYMELHYWISVRCS